MARAVLDGLAQAVAQKARDEGFLSRAYAMCEQRLELKASQLLSLPAAIALGVVSADEGTGALIDHVSIDVEENLVNAAVRGLGLLFGHGKWRNDLGNVVARVLSDSRRAVRFACVFTANQVATSIVPADLDFATTVATAIAAMVDQDEPLISELS